MWLAVLLQTHIYPQRTGGICPVGQTMEGLLEGGSAYLLNQGISRIMVEAHREDLIKLS